MVDWSGLPEELLMLIVLHLHSLLELKRFRSICTSWRRSAAEYNNHPVRRHLIPSRASFFRVTHSSSSQGKGWLIKSDMELNSGRFRLLEPLSRLPLKQSKHGILDLREYTVSEIREAFVLRSGLDTKLFKRLVLVQAKGKGSVDGESRFFGVGLDGKIKYWKDQEVWVRIKNQNKARFSDITVHEGLTYALDSEGRVWWISSSRDMFLFGPPLKDDCCTKKHDKSFVECCGELYIVVRLFEKILGKRKYGDNVTIQKLYKTTVDFKVFKMDMEFLGKLVEVSDLGDKSIVMATDTCFSVVANEYYGCMENSIYFTDDKTEIKVFKLQDGSITTIDQGCFEMFVPSFLL